MISDDKIAWGVVANAGRGQSGLRPRWSYVADATGLGSTSAQELCERFGYDPDALVGSGVADEDGDE